MCSGFFFFRVFRSYTVEFGEAYRMILKLNELK